MIYTRNSGGVQPRQIKAENKPKLIFVKTYRGLELTGLIIRLACCRSYVNAHVLYGYPVVLKPDAGVGALNTCRIENDGDLVAAFNSGSSVDLIAEEFITGELFSFDGLVDRDGRLIFYTAHTFSQGIMETVNEDRHVSYCSLRDIPVDLERVGRASVAAFGLRERFFHIEF